MMELYIEGKKVEVITDSLTQEVTMYLPNESWGPIVTGATYEKALEKFKAAYNLAKYANLVIQGEYNSNKN